jgi:hypothetical protein
MKRKRIIQHGNQFALRAVQSRDKDRAIQIAPEQPGVESNPLPIRRDSAAWRLDGDGKERFRFARLQVVGFEKVFVKVVDVANLRAKDRISRRAAEL